MARWTCLLLLAGALAGCTAAPPVDRRPGHRDVLPRQRGRRRGGEDRLDHARPRRLRDPAVGATTIGPAWGPEPHREPPDEWGTGWVFPSARCWTFVVTRGAATGRVTIRVAESSPTR
ncbi:hypothetical protein [Cryptosporangium arvum]|uniref:hypothetical protein n=1 Tax=Cryptosporangium arvum TaxID=80871 RepID=UPI0004B29990|nr:hypothetical protein [Cryptosporangium arvum]